MPTADSFDSDIEYVQKQIQEYNDLQEQINNVNKSESEYQENVKKLKDEYDRISKSDIDSYGGWDSWEAVLDGIEVKINDWDNAHKIYVQTLDDLTKKQNTAYESINKTLLPINEQAQSITGVTEEGKKLSGVIAGINEAVAKINSGKGIVSTVNNIPKTTTDPATEAAKALEKLNTAIEDSSKLVDQYSSNIDTLSSAYDSINKGEELSSKQLLNLISLYPDYASQILQINSSKENGLSITKTLFQLEKDRYIQEMSNDAKLLENKINLLEADMNIADIYNSIQAQSLSALILFSSNLSALFIHWMRKLQS
jgi:chromosome segregation ATPase